MKEIHFFLINVGNFRSAADYIIVFFVIFNVQTLQKFYKCCVRCLDEQIWSNHVCKSGHKYHIRDQSCWMNSVFYYQIFDLFLLYVSLFLFCLFFEINWCFSWKLFLLRQFCVFSFFFNFGFKFLELLFLHD